MPPASPTHPTRPAAWKLVLALGLLYCSWGTTYLAIRVMVEAREIGLAEAIAGGLAEAVRLAMR